MELDLQASLSLFEGAARRIEQAAKLNARMAAKMMQPVPTYSVSSQASTDTNGNAVLLSNVESGPPSGHVWTVRSIVVGALTPDVAVTGRADVYVSGSAPPSVYPTGGNFLKMFGQTGWRDTSTTLPNIAFYSTGQLVIVNNDQLFVVITGGIASTVYTVSMYVEDYQEGAREQTVAL